MPTPDGDELLKRWVATWRRAGVELEELRRREIESVDTQQAIRQIFSGPWPDLPPAPATSGLIEQQAWFRRLQSKRDG
jgi:hypothetical protein